MFYIYILYSNKSDKYYTGLTTDVPKRLNEHNNPSVRSKYTAKYLPWEVKVFFECSDFRGDGLKVERFIKSQKSRVFLEKLITEKGNREYYDDLIKKILKK